MSYTHFTENERYVISQSQVEWYYGVTNKLAGIKRFREEAGKLISKWLNRRGRRGCLNWQKFDEMLMRFPLLEPRVKVSKFVSSVN